MGANTEYTAWKRVETARSAKRPTSIVYIKKLFTDFIEFSGDGLFADDMAIIGGIGRFNGIPVTIIAEEKGANTLDEKSKRNFGSPHPEGYRKSLRLMKQAEKFNRPVICLVDTQGAYCGIEAEERGQGKAIAGNLYEMSGLKTPIISIIIGEGGSGGALALAVADRIAMLENAIFSIVSPEGFANILWKDSSRVKEAADVMKLTAQELKKLALIDDIIDEVHHDGYMDIDKTIQSIAGYIELNLDILMKMETTGLVNARYAKFRKVGSI
ncbi:MAG: acetyl-CoA carboxylase carboxyltransferase subunit alpha [Lachnospiraceae bacterium]|nr:acetyl-CoA carboxylase carboxyltransferase subunit alpha [Lachnospiraceae bacterium]